MYNDADAIRNYTCTVLHKSDTARLTQLSRLLWAFSMQAPQSFLLECCRRQSSVHALTRDLWEMIGLCGTSTGSSSELPMVLRLSARKCGNIARMTAGRVHHHRSWNGS